MNIPITEKIPIEEYVEFVKQGEIPPYPSDRCNRWDLIESKDLIFDPVQCYGYREECTKRGLWPKLDMMFIQELAIAIGKRSVLEVMSGAGFIGKGLSSLGIEIICTDNYSWHNLKTHEYIKHVHPIRKCRADHAIRKWGYKSDILLVSWPPYGSHDVVDMMQFWDHSKPIIYIGEFDGCNAPEEFTNKLRIEKHFKLQVWDGLHDDAVLAYWED